MFFNSIDFTIFLPIVFFIYWFILNKNVKQQNITIVISSYIFYGWWDWRFLILILFSTLIDYSVGRALNVQTDKRKRKLLLYASIVVNLGLLFFFKYFNFFLDSFAQAFSIFGSEIKVSSLEIILPVGISFYTFQTLSYSIDVYNKKLKPTLDFVSFMSFVSFFPQLVAGPIERAKNLLPQFYSKRTFNYEKSIDGMRQILWGLFKKVVIADNCAEFANKVFDNPELYGGSTLYIGAICFAFQIYGDFSGYSDIAIGTSRLFGFDLKKNFAFPYFSRDIAEFWRRWHISLSTWFRDYVYIPLGGSRVTLLKVIRNTFVVFVVSGFWHGANWTYIAWGALHAIYFLPLLLLKKNRKNTNDVAQGKVLPSVKELVQIAVTFTLSTLAWIFFRADDIHTAFYILGEIFSTSIASVPILPFKALALLSVFVVIEWLGRENEYAISSIVTIKSKSVRWIIYFAILMCVILFPGKEQVFIYFQF